MPSARTVSATKSKAACSSRYTTVANWHAARFQQCPETVLEGAAHVPALRDDAPIPRAPRSSTATWRPPRARCIAALRPVIPEPTIATSTRAGSEPGSLAGLGAASHQCGSSLKSAARRAVMRCLLHPPMLVFSYERGCEEISRTPPPSFPRKREPSEFPILTVAVRFAPPPHTRYFFTRSKAGIQRTPNSPCRCPVLAPCNHHASRSSAGGSRLIIQQDPPAVTGGSRHRRPVIWTRETSDECTLSR